MRIDTHMKQIIDITGQRYGRLVVQRYTGQKNKDGKTLWECQCDCGKITIQNKSNLSRPYKGTKSCGCLRSDYVSTKYWQGIGELSKDYWSSLKRGAQSRNIEFNITLEDMWSLFLEQKGQCAITGFPIKLSRNTKREKPTASLDRIDPSKGYINGNCQWVHKTVNLCKHTLTNEEFINLCKMIMEYQNGKNNSNERRT